MIPALIQYGGQTMWVIMLVGAVALTVTIERVLALHQAQIHTTEFLAGVKNVLKRGSVVEAISICEATSGPVPRLVKAAILNRERGRARIREGIEEAGLSETPRLEANLNILKAITQIAPLLGLLGAALGLIEILYVLERQGMAVPFSELAGGLWKALLSTAAGIGLAVPCHVAAAYLSGRVDAILTDMEKASMEILRFLCDGSDEEAS